MLKTKEDIVISLEGITKKYITSKNEEFFALKNVNLRIRRGDRIGIVGDNGAGKTTLLKIIAGFTKPSAGEMHTEAKIVSLIDLEAGFEPELTGYENIMVNGLIIGMEKQEIKRKWESIILFAGIGEYINEPFFTYSAGMKFRLACAVALNSSADVLLFDEVLISSDLKFQKKVFKTLAKTLCNKQLTTIICSHVPEILWSLANTYYSISHGTVKKISRDRIRFLAVDHHKQFHKTFKTDEIAEFNLDKNKLD